MFEQISSLFIPVEETRISIIMMDNSLASLSLLCVCASLLFLVNRFLTDSRDGSGFIIHTQLTLDLFFSLSELDESSSGQSATVASVWQREEVGAHLRSGGHQSLVRVIRWHQGENVQWIEFSFTSWAFKVVSYYTHRAFQTVLQSHPVSSICVYWWCNVPRVSATAHTLRWPAWSRPVEGAKRRGGGPSISWPVKALTRAIGVISGRRK